MHIDGIPKTSKGKGLHVDANFEIKGADIAKALAAIEHIPMA